MVLVTYTVKLTFRNIKPSRLCLNPSKHGHFLLCRIFPVSVNPKILFTNQNVANDQGINLRVVQPPKIPVATLILFISHQLTNQKTARNAAF